MANFVGIGATGKNTGSGNVTTVGIPVGTKQNDFLTCIYAAADNVVPTFPVGWTKDKEVVNGTTLKLVVARKQAGAAEAAFTITHAAGGGALAAVVALRNAVVTAFEVIGVEHNDTGSGNGGSATANGITPLSLDASMLLVTAETAPATDGGNGKFTTWSGTDPVFSEILDDNNTGGPGECSLGAAYGVTDNGAPTGTRTITMANLATGTWLTISILLSIQSVIPNHLVAPMNGVGHPPFRSF